MSFSDNKVKKHVLIVQRRMTKYRVPLFERMQKRLAEEGIELNVVNGTPKPDEAVKKDSGALPWGLEILCRYWKFNERQFVFQPIPEVFWIPS